MATLTRRKFIGGLGVAAGAATLSNSRLAFAAPGSPDTGNLLVVVFLAGGCDGLSLCPPSTDDNYRNIRRGIAIPPDVALPLNTGNGGGAQFPTGLEGSIFLHPSLSSLHETMWESGQLAVVPAVGMPQEEHDRSHFVAQRYWMAGSGAGSVQGGWLTRLMNLKSLNDAAIPSIAKSPGILLDAPTVPNLANFGFTDFNDNDFTKAVVEASNMGENNVEVLGSNTLTFADRVNAVGGNNGGNEGFPDGELGNNMSEIADLANANVGLHCASVIYNGWDHHDGLGGPNDQNGEFARMARELSDSLAAFFDKLGDEGTAQTTVVVASEYGRTVGQNGGGGTDHGWGGAMLVMGGGVTGGVYGDFPDRVEDDPDNGDLTVLEDYRIVMNEVASKYCNIDDSALPGIFPTVDNDEGSYLGL